MKTDIPVPLVEEVELGRCVPVLGSGFSMNARLQKGDGTMPSWQALGRALATEGGFSPDFGPTTIASIYERAYGRPRLVEAIRKALHYDLVEPGESHRAFTRLDFDTIYTTNFDNLIETVFRSEHKPLRVVVGDHQLAFHGGPKTQTLIKLHGDLEHVDDLVITDSDYFEFISRSPATATHLSTSLMTRTALFVGYSLADADFNQIWNVARQRLGKLLPKGYFVAFADSSAPAVYDRDDRVHVMRLRPEPGESRDQTLARFFTDLNDSVLARASARVRAGRPELFEAEESGPAHIAMKEGPVVLASTSRFCFFSSPAGSEYDRVASTLLRPVLDSAGLTLVTSLGAPVGSEIGPTTRATILGARLIIVDLTGENASVLYETFNAMASAKPIIPILSTGKSLPDTLRTLRFVTYDPKAPQGARKALAEAIDHVLIVENIERANTLSRSGSYEEAVAIAGISIEHLARNLLLKAQLTKDEEQDPRRMAIAQLLKGLELEGVVSPKLYDELARAAHFRNLAVHSSGVLGAKEAALCVKAASDLAELSRTYGSNQPAS